MSRKGICEEGKCTGCFACMKTCPVKCITKGKNEIKNTVPVIDDEKCIDCGACRRVCPVNQKQELKTPQATYAAYAKEESVHVNSASGGVATTISQSFIKNGGIVYGAAQKNGLVFEHIRIDSVDALHRAQGSKYTHSHIDQIYEMISKDLDDHKPVLFIGTPCQVAGIKNYVKDNKQELLYCIDLICHGVPDRNTFMEAMELECKTENFNDYTISFRDHTGYSLKVRDKSGQVLHEKNLKNSYYYNGFMEGYIYRHNCYSCEYARKERVGDLTLGDFWGLGDRIPFDGDKKNGINVVFVNSSKGDELIENVRDALMIWERTLEEAVAGNGQLREPVKYGKVAEKFETISQKEGIKKAILKCNPSKYAALQIRRMINSNRILRSVLTKIPAIRKKL